MMMMIEREHTLDSLNSLDDGGSTDKQLLKTLGRDIVRLNNIVEDSGRKLFLLKVPKKIRKDLKQTLSNIFQAAELSITILGVIDSSFYLMPEQTIQVALCGSRPLQSNSQKKIGFGPKNQWRGGV